MDTLVMQVLYKNILTCPKCSSKQQVRMLALETSSIYLCNGCKKVVQSTSDKCCVYCQYGAVKCPSEQVKWN